jgi:putative transcriptional regulator
MPWGLDYNVKELRARLGISQEEMARQLKVSTNTVVRWERGAMKPRPEMVAKLEALARRVEREGKGRAA